MYQHWFTVTPLHRCDNITDSHGCWRDAVSPVTVSSSSSSTPSLSLRTMSLTDSALVLTRWLIYYVTTLCECMPMCVTVSVSLAHRPVPQLISDTDCQLAAVRAPPAVMAAHQPHIIWYGIPTSMTRCPLVKKTFTTPSKEYISCWQKLTGQWQTVPVGVTKMGTDNLYNLTSYTYSGCEPRFKLWSPLYYSNWQLW